MIDASKGFMKDGNKNRLQAQDIHKIVDVFNRQLQWSRYSRMVPVSEIASPANDYNLNIPRYIDSSEPEDLHDLDAHLRGGIPNRDVDALENYWQVFPSVRAELFEPGDRAGYSHAKVETQLVKATILKHPEFTEYSQKVAAIFGECRAAHEPMLKRFKGGAKPKPVISALSEDLLERFAALPLLNNYDAYQRLMDYWAEVMQDDAYLIASDGWVEAAKPRLAIDNKEKNIRETPDLMVKKKKYKMDLIPPVLIVARYFTKERAEVDELEVKRETAERELEEFIEENSGDEGLLEDGKTDKGTLTKGSVKERLTEMKKESEGDDEKKALSRCLELIEAEAAVSKAMKDAQAELDAKVLAKYAKLVEMEIKTLVVDDKWFATIWAELDAEVQRLTQTLANRVTELEERYDVTLSRLRNDVDELSEKVEAHLKQMGLILA
jgi:type I restriction enzyme M protein